MSLTLANLRAELLTHLGADVEDFDNGNTDIDLLLNRSWWQIMDEFDFREKEATATFSTVSGTRDYNVSTIVTPIIWDALRKVSITDPNTLFHNDIGMISIDTYESEYSEDPALQNIPTNYLREGSLLRLYPTPDQAYTINIYYWQVLANIPTNGVTIPQSWHEIILYGAVWRGFLRIGDYNRGNAAKAYQRDLIASITPVKAKENIDTNHAGLQVFGYDDR